MKTIRQTYRIEAPLRDVWKALVDPKWITGWGGGPAKMRAKVGAKFSLWGGQIYGKNIVVKRGKKLVQEWYGGKWKKPSVATFVLRKIRAGTRIEFLHTRVPDADARLIRAGWKAHYLGPLKNYVEGMVGKGRKKR